MWIHWVAASKEFYKDNREEWNSISLHTLDGEKNARRNYFVHNIIFRNTKIQLCMLDLRSVIAASTVGIS